ncbi:MAG: hypothetical protein JXB49_18145 [Bacteroidales bacterium]|nr:hypothetical protein [Bacteroidales bacterium]
MRNKLHQQTDLLIYEEIVTGRLNPQLPSNGELSVLQNLVKNANTKTFCTCSIEDDPARLIKGFDITELGYQFKEDAEITVKEDPEQKVCELIASPKRVYPLEDHFNLPEPPDNKSAYFLTLIADEFERVKIRANKVLTSTGKKKHLALFAHKNIQRAKKIQYDVRYMLTKIHKPWSSVNDNPDAYVILVLDIFLERIIIYYQQLFQPFIMAFPKDEQTQSAIAAIPVHIKYPCLFRDIPDKPDGYNLRMDGSIFDHQFKNQVDKLKDIAEPNPGYTIVTNKQPLEKMPLQQNQPIGEGIRLKWHGQLNVLVDVMLQLTSSHKINGRPVLEATPDELRLFIRENFLDKDGREISPYTLNTYLKPYRDDKRLHPDSPKRIDMSAFFNTSETEKE